MKLNRIVSLMMAVALLLTVSVYASAETRPEELKCAKCGFVPEAGTSPRFCSECGNAF